MSVAVVLVQAVLGFLGPWIFRDEILAVGADENGNLWDHRPKTAFVIN